MASKFYSKLAAAIVVAALCGAGLEAQEKKKQVKDQAEFDLFQAITKEADASKKLQLLQQWKTKYPDSDFKEERQQMIADDYRVLGQAAKMWEASQDLLAINPKNFLGLYFLTSLTTSMNDNSPAKLDGGEKAAKGLLEQIPEIFKPEKKPAAVTEDAFKKERFTYENLAKRTLAWLPYARKDWEKAEASLGDYLKFNPNSGNVSYWLATSMLQQKKKEKQIPALYHLARAAYYKGDDELNAQAKQQLQAFLKKTYASYHGSEEGLQGVIDLALKEPFPTADFKIMSSQEILLLQDEEFKAKDPQKYLWVGLKKGLTDPMTGQQYWEGQLKDSALPKLKGKVVEMKPATRPKEITISILQDGQAEIKLKLDAAFANKAEPGTEIEFEGGVAKEFVAEPFMLTLEIEKDKITGWPAAPKPVGAVKKAVPKKQ